MLQSNPEATPQEIAEALMTTARHLGDAGKEQRLRRRHAAGLPRGPGRRVGRRLQLARHRRCRPRQRRHDARPGRDGRDADHGREPDRRGDRRAGGDSLVGDAGRDDPRPLRHLPRPAGARHGDEPRAALLAEHRSRGLHHGRRTSTSSSATRGKVRRSTFTVRVGEDEPVVAARRRLRVGPGLDLRPRRGDAGLLGARGPDRRAGRPGRPGEPRGRHLRRRRGLLRDRQRRVPAARTRTTTTSTAAP